MKKYIFYILLFVSQLTFGKGFEIIVDLKSAADKDLQLAYYYLSNIYINDTIKLDKNGVGVFEADTLLPQGLYKIYLDDKNHFDFILGSDQQFQIKNGSFSAQTLQVEGAVETEEFANYVVFLNNLKERSAALRKKMETASEQEKKNIQKELAALTPQLHGYWKKIKKEYPNSFLSKFLMANFVPTLDVEALPENIRSSESLLLRAKFDYQRAHFWDNFDYTDERFLYTPLLKPKLETWFKKVLYPNYDSVKGPVMQFIEEVRPKKRIFQFATSFFLNGSVNSDYMGMDALFVDLARKYYFSGEAFWATEKSLEKIRENVTFAEKNLIGMIAPNLNLESVDGEYFNLHQIESKITILLIYEPNCSHCKVFIPELYNDVYKKYKDKGLTVYAIYSMDDKEEWTEFLTKHNMYDWINVWDEHHVSRFKVLYDARKTPGIFVLDENKKIIAKKLSVEQAQNILKQQLD